MSFNSCASQEDLRRVFLPFPFRTIGSAIGHRFNRFRFALHLFTAALPARTARPSCPVRLSTEFEAWAKARLHLAARAFLVCLVASFGAQGISVRQ
jgi:hypothetical protein